MCAPKSNEALGRLTLLMVCMQCYMQEVLTIENQYRKTVYVCS